MFVFVREMDYKTACRTGIRVEIKSKARRGLYRALEEILMRPVFNPSNGGRIARILLHQAA